MAMKWRVITQQQTERLTPQGTFEAIVKITFQLESGTLGTIEVPGRLYSEDYVREQIAQAASTMAAIETLEG